MGRHSSLQHSAQDPLSLATFASFSLRLLQDAHRLFHLGAHLLLRLQEDEELAVVHLEHHPRDLARKLRLVLGDGGVKLFADHLLLHGRRRCCQGRGVQLACGGGSGRCLLLLHLGAALGLIRRHPGPRHHWHLLHRGPHHASHATHWPHWSHATHGSHAAHRSHAAHGPAHAGAARTAHGGALASSRTTHRSALAHLPHHLRPAHGSHALAHLPALAHRPAHHAHLWHHALWPHATRHTVHHAHARHAAHSSHAALRASVHLLGHATRAALAATLTSHVALATGHTAAPRRVALPEALLASLALLCEADVEGLALDNLEVHLRNSLCGLIR
mmetsp:Transcript_83788/g.179534  ORF Transcript_83788/g.179534 Transcript_83788/m.179534 type:complete len:332 (-) Transcript_83788:1303-2298(-)